MSHNQQTDEGEYREPSTKGQVTIPAWMRGDESGYMIEQTDDGQIILTPANKEEQIEIAQANE